MAGSLSSVSAISVVFMVALLSSSAVGVVDDKCAACIAIAGLGFLISGFRVHSFIIPSSSMLNLSLTSSGVDSNLWLIILGMILLLQEELERGLANEILRDFLLVNGIVCKPGKPPPQSNYALNRVSELRVVELLDGLCDKMQDYTLMKINSTKPQWVKVDDWDNITSNKQEARADSKAISSYCGRLLEENEDELAESIKSGSVKPGGVGKVLCEDLSKHCKQTSSHEARDDEDAEDEAEL
ncbi:hypothetical protein AKJ16_DCAP00988 [Drosera capensis]